MKSNHLFLILLGMFFQLFLISCETASLQKPVSDDLVIVPRNIDDCEDCPVDDCCCQVQLLDGDDVFIQLCGATTPDKPSSLCEETIGPCDISGFLHVINLVQSPDSELFCMAPNTEMYLRSMQTATVRVTCQVGEFMAQSININFPSTEGVIVNGDCEVSECQ